MSTVIECPVIDATLRDLLFREAHLELARKRLAPELSKRAADVRSVRASRSPFDLIVPRRKQSYEARLNESEQAFSVVREQIETLERCLPQVTRRIEDAIEGVLREACPDYVEALAAQRQKEDWLRCLERFARRIHEFTRTLGNVRNLACSGYLRHSHEYSPGALHAFQLAYAAALAVHEEVRFANQIAAAQAQHFSASGVKAHVLPPLPATDFAGWVAKIRGLKLVEAQQEFDLLIEDSRRLYESGVAELRAQADQVEQQQQAEIRNFLLAAWEQFRAEVASEIYPGDTERVLAETSRILEANARTSVTGRL